MWSSATRAFRGAAARAAAAASKAVPAHATRIRSRRVAVFAVGAAALGVGCSVAIAGVSASAMKESHSSAAGTGPNAGSSDEQSTGSVSWLQSLRASVVALLSPCEVSCVGNDTALDEDKHKHAVATKTWRYYSGPGGELSNLRLFTGNSNPELAKEIAQYLGIELSSATVDHFIDGETKIQVNVNVRQTHCFVVQPVSNPVNDSLMELLLMISTLRRASAAEITAVIPYYGYSRADRKLSSRTPISAADVAIMLDEMGVDRVVAVDLHGGQIQGFFPPSVPVENLESMPIGGLYFSEKNLRKPVVVAASAGGVLRAKKFRETLVEQGIESDLAMLIEAREADDAGRFAENSSGKLDLVGNVKGCDCILVEDIVDTATTLEHAAYELKRQGCRHVYGFCTHGLFSSPDSASKIETAPIKELVITNTVKLSPAVDRLDKVTQLTLAPLLAETIRRIYQKRSISGIYVSPITAPASATTAQAIKA